MGGGCEKCRLRGERERYRCPMSMSGPEGQLSLEFAMAFEAGFLPGPGAYGEQSHKGMAMISIARMEKNKIERAAQEAAEAKARG